MNAPIGVLDSGVGGLSVLKEIKKILPNEQLIYFGDTANVPYGSKSPSQIRLFVFEILKYLKTQKVKAVVFACNTSSAIVLDKAKPCFDFPIIGVIKPGIREALKIMKTEKAGLFANNVTVESGVHDKLMQEMSNGKHGIIGKACPDFVPLVESGLIGGPEVERCINKYLAAFDNIELDTLILGCTHYPFLEKEIQKACKNKIKIINPAKETAKELAQILKENNLENKDEDKKEDIYCVSSNPEKFKSTASLLLNKEIENVKLITF